MFDMVNNPLSRWDWIFDEVEDDNQDAIALTVALARELEESGGGRHIQIWGNGDEI